MPMIANGWGLYYYRVFKAALDELEAAVTQLAQDEPKGYKIHPKTKLLALVYKAITEVVPVNPDAPEFRVGKTLGADYTNWGVVNKVMLDRYRLFFRFASGPAKVVIYVWFSDENSSHKTKSKTDVYEIFKRMLERGVVPGSIAVLLQESHGQN